MCRYGRVCAVCLTTRREMQAKRRRVHEKQRERQKKNKSERRKKLGPYGDPGECETRKQLSSINIRSSNADKQAEDHLLCLSSAVKIDANTWEGPLKNIGCQCHWSCLDILDSFHNRSFHGASQGVNARLRLWFLFFCWERSVSSHYIIDFLLLLLLLQIGNLLSLRMSVKPMTAKFETFLLEQPTT
jgi:hypothetical protein